MELKELKKESKNVVEKAEKKFKGDFGFECKYFNGATHFAVDCMLRKKVEKKERIKD